MTDPLFIDTSKNQGEGEISLTEIQEKSFIRDIYISIKTIKNVINLLKIINKLKIKNKLDFIDSGLNRALDSSKEINYY